MAPASKGALLNIHYYYYYYYIYIYILREGGAMVLTSKRYAKRHALKVKELTAGQYTAASKVHLNYVFGRKFSVISQRELTDMK